MKQSKHRIAVAMSGGVDSSVAAALLVQEGYDVFGIYAKTWTPQAGDGTTCAWVADRRDALRVAAHLGIPLVSVDLEADYRRGVVEPLFAGYARGVTPNPDVLCNKVVKFGALWQAAQKLGATQLATGHYARIASSNSRSQKSKVKSQKLSKEEFELRRGLDPNKDQSYFLWNIPPEVLPFVLFPVGGYTKPQVRELARQFVLPVADKKESQGICFLGQTDLPTFLSARIPESQGEIRDYVTGRVVGYHRGIHRLTIGQRHGLGQLAKQPPDGRPRYVVGLDPDTQTVWVGPADLLDHRRVRAGHFSWLMPQPRETLVGNREITAQIRYRQLAQACQFEAFTGGQGWLYFRQSVRAATPGQSVVFYLGDRVLGGGVIESFER